MFNRVELKNKAKSILRKNYWWLVLVTLIFAFVGGTSMNVSINYRGNFSQSFYYGNNDISIDNGVIDEFGNISDSYYGADNNLKLWNWNLQDMLREIMNGSWRFPSMAILCTTLFLALIVCLLDIFVLYPFQVGCRRWYLKNRKEKPEISEILHPFRQGYANTVKIMFCKSLFTFLWTLLFIIPGVIKSYEYRMVPYLLAENPEMDMHEAFDRSKKLMNGNKWDTFVLELSFIGWWLLSSFTYGILSILYVAPYVELTNTELYVCLCQGRERYHAENESGQNPQYQNPYENGGGTNNQSGGYSDNSYGGNSSGYSDNTYSGNSDGYFDSNSGGSTDGYSDNTYGENFGSDSGDGSNNSSNDNPYGPYGY